ncbi:MAG: extracellular solute-binding protein [Chloroflexi bacterium]|nr:extracellular solute-binding protein [Chloroflexota bacterium]
MKRHSIWRSRAITVGVVAVSLVAVGCGSVATPSPAASDTPSQPATSSGTGPSAGPSAVASGGQVGGQVTVWTAWGGNELKAFQAVLKPFTDKTGIEVLATTVRDFSQLAINVDAGTPLPDIAGPPNPDKLSDWATKGIMKPLESFLDMTAYSSDTNPALLAVGVVDGKHYQEMVKTQVKGLQWFNTKVFTGTAPKTYDELLAITPPSGAKLFCVGLESGDASGWPASDMLANIVMRQSGPDVYTAWYQGKQKWSSPEIKSAYQLFGKMVAGDNVYGGANTVLSTNFGRAGKPLFASPPGCMFLEQATFIPSFFLEDYPNLKAGTDFDFFLDPSITSQFDGNIEGFWDSFVMYNDTAQARALMQYMATAEAQQIWVDAGGTLAALKTITKYPDPIFAHAAQVAAAAKNILPTAGDQMPADMQHAFWKSTLDFTNDQSQLDSILANLDQVQAASYTP